MGLLDPDNDPIGYSLFSQGVLNLSMPQTQHIATHFVLGGEETDQWKKLSEPEKLSLVQKATKAFTTSLVGDLKEMSYYGGHKGFLLHKKAKEEYEWKKQEWEATTKAILYGTGSNATKPPAKDSPSGLTLADLKQAVEAIKNDVPKKAQLDMDAYADMVQKLLGDDTSGGSVVSYLRKHFNGMDEYVTCPDKKCLVYNYKMKPKQERPLHRVVVHLNDHHKWTREKIADWVDKLPIDTTKKETEE